MSITLKAKIYFQGSFFILRDNISHAQTEKNVERAKNVILITAKIFIIFAGK